MSTPTTDTRDFSQGSVLSCILRVGGPMTLALVINTLYNIVDRMYIGHIPETGRLALTGLGLVFPVTTVISAFQSLISSGGSPLFAIARGEKDLAKAGRIMNNAYVCLIALSLILTAVGYAVKAPVMWAIGADASTFPFADAYLSIYLIGTFFVMTSVGMNPFINAQGYPKIGMLTVLLGAVVNLALDPLFIFVFHMGVRGAALATIIAQASSSVWVHLFLTGRRTQFRLSPALMKPDFRLIGRMAALGVSGFTAFVTSSAVSMIYNARLSALGGTVWVSAMTVINSLRELAGLTFNGIGQGSYPVLSYNYGAKRYDRVREASRLILFGGLIAITVCWVLLLLFPVPLTRIFNSDPDLLAISPRAIRLYFLCFPMMAFQVSGQTVFTALGHARSASFFSLFRKAILVIPLALAFSVLWGVDGLMLSEPVSDIVGGLACWLTMYFTVYRKLPRE